MSIIYERTFEVEYDKIQMNDNEKRKFAESLQANDLICHSYINDNFRDIVYGEYEDIQTQTHYQIEREDGQIIFDYPYGYIRDDVFKQISNHIEGLSKTKEIVETTTTIMKEVDGERIYCQDMGIKADYRNSAYNNYFYDDEDVSMFVRFEVSAYSNLRLKFIITWETNRVKRADIIENKIVMLPLNDMGIIQRLFEDALNGLGYWTEETTIHCFFETKTETKSECSPDIVKMVRDARNKEEEE